MNTEENKLEGDALWDKITLDLLDSPNSLTADPNREISYYKPINVNGVSILVEDSSKTVWLNKNGEEVSLSKNDNRFTTESETYRIEIIDFNKTE